MNWELLPSDLFYVVSIFLPDRWKLCLLTCSRGTWKLRHIFIFLSKVSVDKINHLDYYNQFTNVVITKNFEKMIQSKYVYGIMISEIALPKRITHLEIYSTMIPIPSTVTHLSFNNDFNTTIKNIPNTITHLKMPWDYNRSIDGCIPSSIVYLKFGIKFNQSIKNNIPSSVKYLKFGVDFNQPIKNNIPSTVTHLTLNYYFDESIKDSIPSSVTHLKIHSRYKHFCKDCVPASIKQLKIFGRDYIAIDRIRNKIGRDDIEIIDKTFCYFQGN